MNKEEDALNYQIIKRDLLSIFEGIALKLEREWSPKYKHVNSGSAILSTMIKINLNTYSTIMFICSETSKDSERSPNFAISIPPLIRTIYESLVAFIFIFENVPAHIELFIKTGYVERRIVLEHCLKYHGTDSEWQMYINSLKAQIAKEEIEFKITANEIKDPRTTIGRWPTPGKALQKIQKKNPTSSAIPFLEFMNSWLYSHLSGLTHLNSPGFIEQGMQFMHFEVMDTVYKNDADEKLKKHLENHRIINLYFTIGLMLALVSEVEIHFNYGFRDRINILWNILKEYDGRSKEIYTRRYASLLV